MDVYEHVRLVGALPYPVRAESGVRRVDHNKGTCAPPEDSQLDHILALTVSTQVCQTLLKLIANTVVRMDHNPYLCYFIDVDAPVSAMV